MGDSSPFTSQPKLVEGLSSHNCTSATICAELRTYYPIAPTDWFALTAPEKSPAFVVRKWGRRNSAAMWHLLGKRAVRNQVVLSAAYTMTGLFVTGSLN